MTWFYPTYLALCGSYFNFDPLKSELKYGSIFSLRFINKSSTDIDASACVNLCSLSASIESEISVNIVVKFVFVF